MSDIIDYKIVSNVDFFDFEHEINQHLDDGWYLHGELVIQQIDEGKKPDLRLQTIVKYKNPPLISVSKYKILVELKLERMVESVQWYLKRNYVPLSGVKHTTTGVGWYLQAIGIPKKLIIEKRSK